MLGEGQEGKQGDQSRNSGSRWLGGELKPGTAKCGEMGGFHMYLGGSLWDLVRQIGDVCHLGFGHEQLGGMSVAERKIVEEPDWGEVGKSKSLLD